MDDMTRQTSMDLQVRSRQEAGRDLPVARVAVRRTPCGPSPPPPTAAASGVRRWVVNAQVPAVLRPPRPRPPPGQAGRVAGPARARASGMLTAADVRAYTGATDGGRRGRRPPSASATRSWRPRPDEAGPVSLVGTINSWSSCCPSGCRTPPSSTRWRPPPRPRPRPCGDLGLHATGTATDAVLHRLPRRGRRRTPSAGPARSGAPGWPGPCTAPCSTGPAAGRCRDHPGPRWGPVGQVGAGRAAGRPARAARHLRGHRAAGATDADMAARIAAHRARRPAGLATVEAGAGPGRVAWPRSRGTALVDSLGTWVAGAPRLRRRRRRRCAGP